MKKYNTVVLPLEVIEDNKYAYYSVKQCTTTSLKMGINPVYLDRHISVTCSSNSNIIHNTAEISQREIFSKYINVLFLDLIKTCEIPVKDQKVIKDYFDNIISYADIGITSFETILDRITDEYNTNLKLYY